ncbi:hypothetical protein L208DRAFT_511781 [Tricholoma matsutake]|nr:hypothetical protein L208DRAFT_511781 [Tricholoma matsutake 945]
MHPLVVTRTGQTLRWTDRNGLSNLTFRTGLGGRHRCWPCFAVGGFSKNVRSFRSSGWSECQVFGKVAGLTSVEVHTAVRTGGFGGRFQFVLCSSKSPRPVRV